MDYIVEWSPEALEDVEEIYQYIKKDSPYYAQTVVEKIINVSRLLNQFPLRGRIVPELHQEAFRERFIYSYRLIYRIQSQTVLIIAVIHGSRLLENADNDFLDAE